MSLILNRCYFCDGRWGKCTCPALAGEESLFEAVGCAVAEPNVSVCGRDFVDPVAYYGEAYVEWAKGNPTHYFAKRHFDKEVL